MHGKLVTGCLAAALACATVALPQAKEPSDPGAARALASARATASGLGGEIRALLMSELQRGGPGAAVLACASGAQAKTAEYRSRTGADVRRVSLRHRSPANAPDDYERAVLASFDRLPRDERAAAEHWEVVSDAGRPVLRYLKPVLTAATCLACHGAPASISAPVRKALDEAYPGDRATGFVEGDVRGAISVRVPIAAQ